MSERYLARRVATRLAIGVGAIGLAGGLAGCAEYSKSSLKIGVVCPSPGDKTPATFSQGDGQATIHLSCEEGATKTKPTDVEVLKGPGISSRQPGVISDEVTVDYSWDNGSNTAGLFNTAQSPKILSVTDNEVKIGGIHLLGAVNAQ
jgi:hypothetical protein